MFLLRRPTDQTVRRLLETQRTAPYSYAETGATRGPLPAGYTVDRHRVRLGTGAEAFERARSALRRWEMFRLGWVELLWPDAPVQSGSTVAVLARALGLWALSFSRILYVLNEPGVRFGFAYGTLARHVERGEERFLVELDPQDGAVWYEILAFSRPQHPLARLGYPVTRWCQQSFARDSKAAMLRATQVS
jgi:uncharacterized protein (UPF0548 family)